MKVAREDLGEALRVDRKTGVETVIEASAITDPQNKLYQYFCRACAGMGHRVGLRYFRPSRTRSATESFDPESGEKLTDINGVPILHDVSTRLSARFNRKAGAPEHRCDHPVRFSALRQIGLRFNATQVADDAFVFPVHVPGRALGLAEVRDIRRAERPRNMGFNRIEGADEMARLLTVLARDPGLHLRQKFDDGQQVRGFEKFYYESPVLLYEDLSAAKAVGRFQSRLVAMLVHANTSQQALRDERNRNCVIDYSRPKLGGEHKLDLLVRGSGGTFNELFKEARLGQYHGQHLLVFGEAYLVTGRPQVEIEVFRRKQFCRWDSDFRFMPKTQPLNTRQMALI